MTKRFCLVIGLGACLALAGCQSGPSSSAPDRTAEQERALAVERRAGFLEGLLDGRHTAARLINDLAAALPERVRLTEGVYESAVVRVKGHAPSNHLIADYIARLGRSSVLTEVTLQSSVQKSSRGGEYQEFALRASVGDPGGGEPETPGPPAARLEELEKLLPARQETVEMLREFQMLALGSGLQMTKFALGKEIPGEFYAAWPVAIELAGSQAGLGRYFNDLAGSRRLWLVEKFSFKVVSPQEARSPLRVSIMARTYLNQ
ncbi:MAG: type 4a pilus biogenesis protein PilO [Candidatus Aminicenantes bacterium]|nr:type 4a pilus biogenesis protein PilO [Candidatus Aminicenantes bacterium]